MMNATASASAPKVALITGASRGLGRQIAVRFGGGHWRVVVNFKERKQEADNVVQAISQAGGQALAYQADVRFKESVKQMVEAVLGQWDRIDLLINNAGITRDALLIKMKESYWDEVLDTNLKGAFHCIQAVAKTMMRQKAGHIINIASLAGIQGAIGQAAYSSSKAGLIGLTKAAARELGLFGIQVNSVLPGFIPTEMGLNLSPDKREKIIEANALGRSTTMEEVADFVFHLSSIASASGQVFNLDSRMVY